MRRVEAPAECGPHPAASNAERVGCHHRAVGHESSDRSCGHRRRSGPGRPPMHVDALNGEATRSGYSLRHRWRWAYTRPAS
jgi:hypothetical protein